jgi:tripeptidyl-peptidase I
VDTVKAWLVESGIDDARIKLSQGLNWLDFNATVPEAENLLNTKYDVYEHVSNGQGHVACDSYSLPQHVVPHVDFVTPTVHFDAKVKPGKGSIKSEREKREVSHAPAASTQSLTRPNTWNAWLPKLGKMLSSPRNIIQQLQNCDEQIVPNCLRVLYNFGPGTSANKKNSYGIVEYTPQAYVPGDLDLFFRNFSRRQVGDRPITDLIDGAVVQQQVMNFSYNGESDLDLEYAMSLTYPQKVGALPQYLRSTLH